VSLVTACTELVGLLDGAGIPADLERSRVHTPGAWVTPTQITEFTLSGGGVAEVDVVLVVAATGETNELTALSGLLTQLLDVPGIDVAGPVDTQYALVLTGGPLPAWRVPVTLHF
jgi:hypothetical protein